MDDQITEIIARKFQGTASQQDLALLQQWLEAAAENRQEFEQLEQIWNKGADLFQAPAFNTGAAWEKVDHTIRKKEKRSAAFPIKRLAIAVGFMAAVFTAWYIWRSGDASMQLVKAANTNRSLTLPDGSSVVLRKGTTIQYASKFNGPVRRVELKGEAWFQVQPDTQQPFLISTEHSTIRVLGTSFLVNATEEGDEVIVSSGKVSMAGKQKEGKQVILTAGQKALLSEGELLQEAVSDSNYLAWKTGILEFRNTPLPEVLDDLSDYYDLQLIIPDTLLSSFQQLNINARFLDQPVSEVLEELRLTTGLQTKDEAGRIIFFRN
ncbi:FecR family protein [Pseudoflavitalea rhizosphaerae]|uniref:FecR family protein n=1 Tax=Pseudoflavitalea rhizosphaerae TaxID=1884793 RepID=UPI000F8E1648|nr:FecR domain-containing protein [Pseudoflavitalea rhizosphaerae]